MPVWNPWHGCKKISAGCQNCYVYRIDKKHGKNSMIVNKTAEFDLPVRQNKNLEYKLHSEKNDYVYTCFSSDFFLEEADKWRAEAWKMIKIRKDLNFFIITKRIHRFEKSLPDDWGSGYENVTIGCTVENQDRADFRLPLFLDCKIKNKVIICEPLLENVNLLPYLDSTINLVVGGGESGGDARICDYEWVLNIRNQCIDSCVSFNFRQTGTYFRKDDKIYTLDRKIHHIQARKANIDYKFK